MSFEHFDEDLIRGGKGEDIMVAEKEGEYKGLKRILGNHPDYDLIDNAGYTFEVKTDYASKKYRNVAIEYWCDGKWSGILTTKAIDWLHIYWCNNKWMYSQVNVYSLKQYIQQNNPDKKPAGNDKNAYVFLIPKTDFVETFDVHSFKNISIGKAL